MAAKWNNEYAVVAEHKDLQASTMAVDMTGQYALLAGRRCLALINVSVPSNVIKKVPRQSKWEVGSAEWNPHPHYSNYCAISSNQRTEILSWNSEDLTTVNSLRSHTRAVSDLNWHRFDPTLLATCSVDTFINVWDIRDPRKPSISLSAVVGATQVRWNRVNGHLIATAHEGDVRIWDTRKVAPVQYIAAHLHKIHGLDWSINQENQLATSSQDCTVKFFDVENPRVVENALRTICPVWRARYTPFGEGMTTTQLRRGENSLLLWSLADLSNPVHSFVGHTDVVLEFDWRRGRQDDDYQLITWSKDQSIRVWRVDSSLQKLCGHEPDNEQPIEYGDSNETFKLSSDLMAVSLKNDKDIETGMEVVEETILPDPTRLPSHKGIAASIAAAQAVLSHTLSPSPLRKQKVITSNSVNNDGTNYVSEGANYSFLKEVELLNKLGGLGPNDSITISDVDDVLRSFTASLRTLKHLLILHITLPLSYPSHGIPVIQVAKGTTVDAHSKVKINKMLKQAVTATSRKGVPCLESVFQQLINSLDHLTHSNDKGETEASKSMTLAVGSSSVSSASFRLSQSGIGHSSFLPTNSLFNNLTHHQDHNIPYPRSSGARFCSAGMLICFGRPSYLRRVNSKTTDSSTTPRSLSVNQSFASLGLASHGLAVSSNSTPYGLLYPPVAQSPTGDPSVSISSFYNQDRRQKSRQTTKTKNRLSSISGSSDVDKRGSGDVRHPRVVGVVTIYDASGLMPIQYELAEHYVFSDSDVAWMCTQNAAVAAQFGRKDLMHVWSLSALLASPTLACDVNKAELNTPWAQNPFGRKLLHSIIDHYAKQRDIQTVAMLCCAFGIKDDNQDSSQRKKRSESGSERYLRTLKPGESPYHTIHPGDAILDNWAIVSGFSQKQVRSNSWSDSLDDFRIVNSSTNNGQQNNRHLPVTSLFPPNPLSPVAYNGSDRSDDSNKDRDSRLLNPEFNGLFDNYRRCYADILYRWGLLEARVTVLKYLSPPSEPFRGVDFVVECTHCRQTVRGPQCNVCKRLLLTCIICRVVVKGSASFCLVCGHGGHALHIAHWFAEENTCPTGCGCQCLVENMSMLSA